MYTKRLHKLLTQFKHLAPIRLNLQQLMQDPEYRNQAFRTIAQTDDLACQKLVQRIQSLEDQLDQIYIHDACEPTRTSNRIMQTKTHKPAGQLLALGLILIGIITGSVMAYEHVKYKRAESTQTS